MKTLLMPLILLMGCFVADSDADNHKSRVTIHETSEWEDGGTTEINYKNVDGKEYRAFYYPPYYTDEVGVFELEGELLEHGDPRIKEFASELKKWVDEVYGKDVFAKILAIKDSPERWAFQRKIEKEKGINFNKDEFISLGLIAHFYKCAIEPPVRGGMNLRERYKKWGLSEEDIKKELERRMISPAEEKRRKAKEKSKKNEKK
jgi:hypothetical protein